MHLLLTKGFEDESRGLDFIKGYVDKIPLKIKNPKYCWRKVSFIDNKQFNF